MNHAELVKRAARWLRGTRRCAVVLEEPNGLSWLPDRHSKYREIPDAIGFESSGRAIVVECKTCRSDFLGDKHKTCRRAARDGGGLGDERWYLVEPGVIEWGNGLMGGQVYGDKLYDWGVLELVGGRVYRRVPSVIPARDLRPEVALLVACYRRATWSEE